MRSLLAAYCAGVMLGSFVIHLQASLFINTGMVFVCLAGNRWVRRAGLPFPVLFRALPCAACFFLGMAYHAAWGWQATAARLPLSLAGDDLVITGTVIDLPQSDALASRFRFAVECGPETVRGAHILLRDYGELALAGGQRWRFSVRLQPPRGLANPGAFDYEAWLLQQGIRATGYVRDPASALLIGERSWSPAWWRQRVADQVAQLSAHSPLLTMLLPALVLGERGQIDSATWDTFTRTGTNHLFVISGLHIGLVAAWCYFLVNGLARLLPTPQSAWPSQKLAALAAVGGACCYALLAGFGLPAQRALVMIAVFMTGSVTGRSINLGLRLLLALAAVLTLNPLAALGAGFWLSFTAVTALLLFSDTIKTEGRVSGEGYEGWQWWIDREALQRRYCRAWTTLVKPQGVVFIALFLPLALWMGQVSLLAPLVNMLAIPVLGFIIVPLALLAVLVSPLSLALAGIVLQLVQLVLGWMIHGLQLTAHGLGDLGEQLQFYSLATTTLPVLLACLAVLLLLLPLPWTLRWLALPLCLAYVLPDKAVDDSALQVHVLDVGQGLAVLVEQRDRFLVYDTGARLGENYDMGSAVLLPVLRVLGARQLDWLIISHGDNDHAGGYAALTAALPVRRILVGGAVDIAAPAALPCRAGQSWQWLGAELRILHPDRVYAATNDNSCVLQLRYGEHALLLPGDITRGVEWQLASRYSAELRSAVLLAPHHGSRTSSSYPLLKTVAPDWAVFSAGHNNSFGHPAPDVVARYRDLDIATLNTADTGMISFRLGADLAPPETFRNRQRRYWRWSQNRP